MSKSLYIYNAETSVHVSVRQYDSDLWFEAWGWRASLDLSVSHYLSQVLGYKVCSVPMCSLG